MTKIISFSLWGKDPKYCQGAIENAKIASEIYPGWICRFYCRKDVPYEIVQEFINLNCQFVMIDGVFGRLYGEWEGLFWRFSAASDPTIDIMISRDTDSILNWKEKAAVDDWLENSTMPFHIMRDHPYHGVPILGGMWGCKKNVFPEMTSWVQKWLLMEEYRLDLSNKGSDQIFLSEVVWPLIKEKHIAHDERFHFSPSENTRPFPKHEELPEGMTFVGQIIER